MEAVFGLRDVTEVEANVCSDDRCNETPADDLECGAENAAAATSIVVIFAALAMMSQLWPAFFV